MKSVEGFVGLFGRVHAHSRPRQPAGSPPGTGTIHATFLKNLEFRVCPAYARAVCMPPCVCVRPRVTMAGGPGAHGCVPTFLSLDG